MAAADEGNYGVKTVVKILSALLVVVALGGGVGFFFVPDETLRSLPGGQGEALVAFKTETREDAAHWSDEVIYSAKSVWWDVSGGDAFDTGPRVVVEIPRAVREQLSRPRNVGAAAPKTAATAKPEPEQRPAPPQPSVPR